MIVVCLAFVSPVCHSCARAYLNLRRDAFGEDGEGEREKEKCDEKVK